MFRFSTRDLLWLTVVIGMSLGWWTDRERATRNAELRAAHSEAMRRGMEKAKWDLERLHQGLRDQGVVLVPPRAPPTPASDPKSPAHSK